LNPKKYVLSTKDTLAIIRLYEQEADLKTVDGIRMEIR